MTSKEAWYTRFSAIILIGFLLLTVEYVLKALVRNYSPRDGFELMNILMIRRYSNPNIAFGIPLPHGITLILSAIILGVLGYYFVRYYRDAQIPQVWALNLILWGAVANFYDRLKYGQVFDYITIPNFPIFNLADLLIIIGVSMFIYCSLFGRRASKTLSPA